MPRREITSYSNPTIKALRSLREKKHRQREQRFLAEGLRLLTDARESGRVPEVLVMASKRDPHPLIDALERAVEAAGGDVIETTFEDGLRYMEFTEAVARSAGEGIAVRLQEE